MRFSPLLRLRRPESGASAIEYAMWAAFIGTAIVGALLVLGPEVQGTYNDILIAVQQG